MRLTAKDYFQKHIKEFEMPKPKKRGRKPGVKVGPYKTFNVRQMMAELKELRAKVAKLEKVFN